MDIADKTIRSFLNEIAIKPGTPAGGSIAALSAASAASMTEMVIRHTIDKVDNPQIINGLTKSLTLCSFYRNEFLRDMDRDTKCYQEFISVMHKKTSNENEKNEKHHKIQNCYRKIVNVPLEIAHNVIKLIEIIEELVCEGNENYLSDSKAAHILAKCTVQSLIYHIKFNLTYVDDLHFIEQINNEIDVIQSLSGL